MKIGFDATVLAPATRLTGGGEYSAHLLRALAAINSGDKYVLYGSPGMPQPNDIPGSITWRELPRVPLSKLSSLFWGLFTLPRAIRRDGIDVFHTPTVHTRPSMSPVPHGLHCPLAVTVHDLIPKTFYQAYGQALPFRMRVFYDWNLRRGLRADRVLTVSETSRQDIQRFSGLPGDRVTAIYNGVDPPCSTGHDDSSLARLGVHRSFILFVGSWEPRKNLRTLLAAFDLAQQCGLDLDLVLVVERESGHARATAEFAKKLSCWDRVTLLHSVSEPDLWVLYRRAEIFAYPSLFEGFGLPPVQAMACGTPVVSSPAGALREVLGDAPLYVDPLDRESIAEGLLRASRDNELRQQLSFAGREQAKRYSWDEAARRTTNVYHALSRKANYVA